MNRKQIWFRLRRTLNEQNSYTNTLHEHFIRTFYTNILYEHFIRTFYWYIFVKVRQDTNTFFVRLSVANFFETLTVNTNILHEHFFVRQKHQNKGLWTWLAKLKSCMVAYWSPFLYFINAWWRPVKRKS